MRHIKYCPSYYVICIQSSIMCRTFLPNFTSYPQDRNFTTDTEIQINRDGRNEKQMDGLGTDGGATITEVVMDREQR